MSLEKSAGSLPDAGGPHSEAGQVLPGGGTWPTVEELVARQAQVEDDSIKWLSYCKELSRRRLPADLFEQIPPVIWRFRVSGSKVVIMRTPQVEQLGNLILPENAKKPNETGWVLTVGPNICYTNEANIRGREYRPTAGVGSDFDPLLLVGDLVLVNRHAGQPLVSSLIDIGSVHRSKDQEFIQVSIADIFGPLVQVEPLDWSPVQTAVTIPEGRKLIV